MAGEPVIAVRGLSAEVGGRSIVRDVHLDVGAGEVVALLGPSGAGKTTVAAAVAGVDRPGLEVTGAIEVAGRVGYLPQHAAATLNPARRIGAALGEYASLGSGAGRERVAEVLRTAAFDVDGAELAATLRKYPSEFSGGQRTRLALAQVLAVAPDALVLDEPTAGLDALSRADLVRRLAVLRDRGMAVLLVTHDPFVAEELADRALQVCEGELAGPARFPAAAAPPVSAAALSAGRNEVELRGVGVPHRLADVDLQVAAGEVLGVIGASGAGKSSLARCVAGLLEPQRGQVLIGGRRFPRLRKRSRQQLAQVQHVWQESAGSFEPRRPVLDQVAATAVRLRGLDAAAARDEAVELLRELAIAPEQAARHPAGLSGGQLQRAAVARALLAHPRVLICDEVTNGLDQPLSAQILDHIARFRHEHGCAVINISHDVRSQLQRADRVAVVADGRIAEVGTPGELLQDPRSAHLRDLLHAEGLTPAPR
ncbi:ABC transporter ATP-binding protein [Saccharopolyspora sp. HNM0983]|uniref:ABC transporter ATP-binding protein n=1 Tax=Saccharopolyspora montiporae TaxID=2781240 RepID=A0A929B9L8_9PSEU|nr:ATP-binding cassette domain-containing protein [Saccharopolyspora sp. HNM0983]MBE9373961.1 ABC transporter ATP-binding protein [Saccharopolyspora sp. HNM0983]